MFSLWVYCEFVLLYYVYAGDVWYCIYREREWSKTYIVTCLDYLYSCYIDPMQKTKVNIEKRDNLIKKSFYLVLGVSLLLVILCVFVVDVCFVVYN